MASRKLDDLTPKAKAKCEAFLAAANLALAPKKLTLLITCTYRSPKEQNTLYAQGRTKPGKVVTNAKHSVHTDRKAWDVAFNTAKGEVTWEGPWETLGAIARKLGIYWGGDWKSFHDRPHFQI